MTAPLSEKLSLSILSYFCRIILKKRKKRSYRKKKKKTKKTKNTKKKKKKKKDYTAKILAKKQQMH